MSEVGCFLWDVKARWMGCLLLASFWRMAKMQLGGFRDCRKARWIYWRFLTEPMECKIAGPSFSLGCQPESLSTCQSKVDGLWVKVVCSLGTVEFLTGFFRQCKARLGKMQVRWLEWTRLGHAMLVCSCHDRKCWRVLANKMQGLVAEGFQNAKWPAVCVLMLFF